jgi:hypothetical protein
MRPASRGSAAAHLLRWLLPLGVPACFVDAPNADDAATGSSSSTSGAESTSSTGDTLDTVDTTTTSEETTSEPATSDTSSSESSSTGNDSPQCGCPEPNLFCDGFEMFPGPWAMPGGGGGIEMQDNDDAMCGAASGLIAVQETNQYAVLTGSTDASAAELFATRHSLRMFIKVDPLCGSQGGFVRVVELQYKYSNGGHIYSWQVAVVAGQLRLTGTNHMGIPQNWIEATALPDEWVQLELVADFTAELPTASVLIDGDLWIESGDPAAIPLTPGRDTATPVAMALGPFFYMTPFAEDCTVRYDDVSVSLVETD